MTILQRVTRAIPARGLFALALVAAALCSTTVARSATTRTLGGIPGITVDGNLTDFIQYANELEQTKQGCGLILVDKPDANGNPTPETIYNDAKFIPCPTPQPALGTHWVNGVEIFNHYLAYAHGTSQLYLAIHSEGFIGDADGNSNPDNSGGGSCNPDDNIEDTIGISGNELYSWSFDLNCDGATDATLKIQDNAIVGGGLFAGATGTFAFRQNAGTGATGHDLEVLVNLPAPLPAAFKYVRVESNAFDGLSEDRADGAICVATPDINVLKSADPITVCPNGKTRFTITVQNTGQTPLSVVAVDNLPSALSYADNLSSTCGVGAPQVVGNVLTFPAFNLAAGANCTISFDALASPECFGQVTNAVDVTGTFSSLCIAETGALLVTDHAETSVTCKAPPCVELSLDCPAQVCTGKSYDVTATAKNCSLEAEDITINIDGTPFSIPGVAAGATVSRKITVVMPACTGQPVGHTATAVGTNSCSSTPTQTKNCSTNCAPDPCVELTFECPPSACAGAPIDLKGTAKNCSTGPESITITIDGTDYVIADVAAGASVSRTKTVTMPQCTPGAPVNYNASAVATNACNTTAPVNKNCAVQCLAGPCVSLTLDPTSPACKGAKVILSGKAKNCGDGIEDITVKYGDTVVKVCDAVGPGGECAYSFEVTMPACDSGTVPFVVTAIASADCGSTSKDATYNVPCQTPQIDVVKSAQETSVTNLGTIHYTITVKNPSATVALENIVVTDHLCSYARYANNANIAPFTAPAVGAGGDVVWHIDALAPGAQVVFTFQVTADVAFGGGACPTTVSCPNVVDVIGYCLGSNGQSSVTDTDQVTTPITCAGEACPRTPGFWQQQCKQLGNGSTKFTKAQVTSIAECIDDRSAFFNWTSGTDFDQFCRTITPPTPMDQRKQAKRQFACLMANACTDALNLQPSQGGKIFLDPSTPVHCDGLNATTIGQLIDEVDAMLIALEGKSLNDQDVKNQYTAIISCCDGINNGLTIAVRSDCPDGGTVAPTSTGDELAPTVDSGASVELYRPMPNPFSGTTSFSYMVSGPDAAGVEITVYDVAGRQIRKLVGGEQTAGIHTATWDGKNDQGAQVQRGVYFVRTVIAGHKESTNRILYLTNGR